MKKKIVKILKKIKSRLDLYINFSDDNITFWINKIIENKNFNIVQIGSNDGKTGDPLHKLILKNKNWNALFVEPIPYLFERLKENYIDIDRFKFENVAINDGSTQIFFSVDKKAIKIEKNLPVWYDQLGSFDKNNILKHLNGKLSKYIIETEINWITLNELLKRNSIEKIDILHIDTEGYDWKILSQLDLNQFKPKIILFEHRHLAVNERNESVLFLKNYYLIYKFDGDFLCIRNELLTEKLLEKLKKRLIKPF